MLDPDAIARVVEVLSPEMFSVPSYQQLFQACLTLYNTGRPIDLQTLWSEFNGIAGHYPFEIDQLAAMQAECPTSVNIVHYANIVRDKYQLRCVLLMSHRLQDIGYRPGATAADVLEKAQSDIFAVVDREKGSALKSISSVMKETYESIQRASENDGDVTGVSTGYGDIDKLTGGLQRSEVTLLAARPGMGKTSLALNIAENVAKDGKGVVVFSLEMSNEQLARRIISSETSIDSYKLRSGMLPEPDWQSISKLIGEIASQPIWFDESSRHTVASIRSKLRRALVKDSKVKLVVVDYIQLMAQSYKKMDQYQAVSQISSELKTLAREFNIPILACCQLNRKVEESRGKQQRPQLSDLRDSGALEQDADVVLFLWREADESVDHVQMMKLLVAKNRNGPAGIDVDLLFRKSFTRFESTTVREFEG